MSSWIKLGWKEFWLPFIYRKPGGCPGGRDFVWLTIFMFIILTLILLLSATKEGLLNRFVDVFLGNVPEHGVPISVSINMTHPGGTDGIDRELLGAIKKIGSEDKDSSVKIPSIEVQPFREIETEHDKFVGLPGEPDTKIWDSAHGIDFNGWAVYKDDPLWDTTGKNSDSYRSPDLQIILSRALFQKFFSYDKYKEYLSEILPNTFSSSIPDLIDMKSESPLDTIWLQIQNGMRKELLPFKIHWTDRFPVIDKIAFVFPLSTYQKLIAADRFPQLHYFPESKNRGERIQKLFLLAPSDKQQFTTVSEDWRRIVSILGGGKVFKSNSEIKVDFNYPIRKDLVAAFAKQQGIEYIVDHMVRGDEIRHNDGKIFLPCNFLEQTDLPAHMLCDEATPKIIAIDDTAKGYGFWHVLVYVPDRTALSKVVDKLLKIEDGALFIHSIYQDALNRFSFLSKLIKTLQQPYGILVIFIMLTLLGIQIGSIVGHRRHNYGIFLAKGVQWWQIYLTLWFQIILSTLIGIFVSFFALFFSRNWLSTAIERVAVEYKETLKVTDLNIFPLKFTDYFITWIIVTLVACLLSSIILYSMPLRWRTHPSALIQYK